MKKASSNEIQRGQSLSFRVPSDTPDHILKHLQKIKETEKRNFSSKIAEYVMQGVNTAQAKDRETVTIPIPKGLTKVQRDWLKHEHSEALLGSIVYQLINDPLRATSLLASLNSNAADIDEALYLQEEPEIILDNKELSFADEIYEQDEHSATIEMDDIDDDLMDFDWEKAKQDQTPSVTEVSKQDQLDDLDDLLGGFLAHMNK